ncbi:MAG: hypothetical protein OSB00_15245 [Sphingomonas bacterium]|nr:hypothetical protein [Sphingomonas bacterium]
MRLPLITALLSTACLAACGGDDPRPVLTPDPAKLAQCQRVFPAFPQLPPLAPFKLSDGRVVVLFDQVRTRDTITARYVVKDAMRAWQSCESPVAYVEDWDAAVTKPAR